MSFRISLRFMPIRYFTTAVPLNELRDAGIFESAIEQPRATFGGQFLHAFPFEMAAAYLFHIVNNHLFVDGNKRTGTVAALVFLDWNNEGKKPNEFLGMRQ